MHLFSNHHRHINKTSHKWTHFETSVKIGLVASRGVEPLIAYVVQVQNYVFVNLREEMKLGGHTLSTNVVRRGEGSKRFKMCGYP